MLENKNKGNPNIALVESNDLIADEKLLAGHKIVTIKQVFQTF